MPIALSARFTFELEHDADALLQFEAASMPGQVTLGSATQVDGARTLNRVTAQDGIGERIWIHAKGEVKVRYQAQIEIERDVTALEPLSAIPLHCLPGEAVKYLLDSRYCHPAQFVAFTDDTFGHLADGARVAAIRDWVQDHIAYTPGASAVDTNATDTFHSGQGICRDYAHVFITLARACSIPTRYVACYAPGVEPQDFHAVAQVYLADEHGCGAWHLVDPTGMADLTQAAIIGVGRDAGDVSFLTSFGPMQFVSCEVEVMHSPGASNDQSAADPKVATAA
jgi:transglutaminase-like putative cysteine protease